MIVYFAFPLFLVPVAALLWRMMVSQTHIVGVRIGAAVAAMLTTVGAIVVSAKLLDFDFRDWRSDAGLAAAASGSLYLLGWAQLPHTNRRHNTVSVVAAIIGLIPIAGGIATGLLFGGEAR